MNEVELIPLNKIRRDGGTQSRAAIDQATVDEYADALINARNEPFPTAKGWPFPPVTVWYDGDEYHLSDGYHRTNAAIREGWFSIPAIVRQGTRRDAVLDSVGVNADHGLRRTQADKRRAVMRLLEDAEWGQWSDREIARRCRVSGPFVGDLRAKMPVTANVSSERTYTDRHGNVTTMNTERIGKGETAVAPDNRLATPPIGWPKIKDGKCPTCGKFSGMWYAAEWQDLEDASRLRAELDTLIKEWNESQEPRQSHPQASSGPAIALRDHWSLYRRGQCNCGLKFWSDREFNCYHEPISVKAETAPAASVARWVDTLEPVPLPKRDTYMDTELRKRLHFNALVSRPDDPLSIVEEWATAGPNHASFPKLGFHPTTPYRDQTIADVFRRLLEYGFVGTGADNTAIVDGWAFCAPVISAESLIVSLADESHSMHKLRIKEYSRDHSMTADEIRAAAREIQQARGWGKQPAPAVEANQFMADRAANAADEMSALDAVKILRVRGWEIEHVNPPLNPGAPHDDLRCWRIRGLGLLRSKNDLLHMIDNGDEPDVVDPSVEEDVPMSTPAIDPIVARGSVYTDESGTTYHRQTVVNRNGDTEHRWLPANDETMTDLRLLRDEVYRKAAGLSGDVVGIGCVAALARAGVELDNAIRAYEKHGA